MSKLAVNDAFIDCVKTFEVNRAVNSDSSEMSSDVRIDDPIYQSNKKGIFVVKNNVIITQHTQKEEEQISYQLLIYIPEKAKHMTSGPYLMSAFRLLTKQQKDDQTPDLSHGGSGFDS
jgi:hypothetical protein